MKLRKKLNDTTWQGIFVEYKSETFKRLKTF